MERVSILGLLVKLMRVISLKHLRTVSVSGKDFRMIVIWENGATTKPGVTECINGIMVIAMKASGKQVLKVARVPIISQTRMSILECLRMVVPKAMDSISGNLGLSIPASSSKE